MTKTMKAVAPSEAGPLTLTLVDAPTLKRGEVMVQVAASGLNRADLAQRAGAYPPPPGASPVLGLEVAGTVVERGAGCSRWAVGDRVCGLLAGGGYAQFAAIDEGSLLPVPDDMDFVTACCFPEALFTVWANVFDRGALKKGEVFLCHGGTSGIGVMAVQMARLAGAARVHATAGSDEKCELLRDLGCDLAVNYRTQDFVEIIKDSGGTDVILDMVGGDYVQKNISVSRLNGRIVNIAYQNGFQTEVNFAPVLMKRLTLAATTLRARSVAEKKKIRDAVERDFWPAVLSGAIRPVLDSSFPVANAESAHQKLAKGGHSGKIILIW